MKRVTGMLYKALFGIVFLSQIFVISFYFPRKVSRLARGAALPEASRPLRVYAVLNHAMIGIGLILMAVVLSLDTVTSMIPILLSIGIFFFLRVSPLTLPGVQRGAPHSSHVTVRSMMRNSDSLACVSRPTPFTAPSGLAHSVPPGAEPVL